MSWRSSSGQAPGMYTVCQMQSAPAVNPPAAGSSDGRVVKASASGAVDSGLSLSRVKPMTLKLVFTAFLLDVQHRRDSVKNKPASLLAMPLGKAVSEIPPFWCGGHVAGNS